MLTSTAEKIDRPNGGYRKGFSLKYGFGRVNAEAAVESATRASLARPPQGPLAFARWSLLTEMIRCGGIHRTSVGLLRSDFALPLNDGSVTALDSGSSV